MSGMNQQTISSDKQDASLVYGSRENLPRQMEQRPRKADPLRRQADLGCINISTDNVYKLDKEAADEIISQVKLLED